MATKDFGAIENDYAFFMAHATEAECDVAEYVRELAAFPTGRPSIRLLDFGCGAGDFTARLLSALKWPPEVLRIALVEPVQHQREEAVRRLAQFSRHAIESLERLPPSQAAQFDVVLSNHVLYYVDALDQALRQMRELLRPGGKMLLAIASWDNTLMQLWKTGFALLGRPVPYHAAEDVEAALLNQGARPRKTRACYQLRFPDTEENRLKILRFLFGEHLQEISPQRLLGEFDRLAEVGHVQVKTHSEHFTIDVSQPV